MIIKYAQSRSIHSDCEALEKPSNEKQHQKHNINVIDFGARGLFIQFMINSKFNRFDLCVRGVHTRKRQEFKWMRPAHTHGWLLLLCRAEHINMHIQIQIQMFLLYIQLLDVLVTMERCIYFGRWSTSGDDKHTHLSLLSIVCSGSMKFLDEQKNAAKNWFYWLIIVLRNARSLLWKRGEPWFRHRLSQVFDRVDKR